MVSAKVLPRLLVALTLVGSIPGQERETVTIRGRALDEAGKPIAGACLAHAKPDELTTQSALDQPAATSNADGRFELSWTMLVDRMPWWVEAEQLLITAPGRAAGVSRGYLASDAGSASDLGDIVLPAAVVIRGNVRGEDGKPLAGVRVSAADVLAQSTLAAFTSAASFPSAIAFESRATTDEKGRFVLPGVLPPGAALTFTAPGFRSVQLPFVTPLDPLVVQMAAGGFVEGVVQDGEGKPAEAYVSVEYEVGEVSGGAELGGVDGRFKINLDWPHRYRVTGWLRDGSLFTGSARSGVLVGPQSGVTVRPAARRPEGPTFSVRVLDEQATGAVEHIEAAALWSDPAFLRAGSSYLDHLFSSNAVQAEQPGEVRLPGPREHEPSTGVVIVKARGYAPATLQGVVWDEDAPPALEVKLVRESVLAGVVVDAATGKPVEGAFLVVAEKLDDQPWQFHSQEAEKGGQVTDKEGRFRIGGLGAGKHTIRATLPFRPDSETLAVELAAREERGDLEFAIPTGAQLMGRIVGVESKTGWGARLVLGKSRQFSSGFDPYGRESRTARVASDGSFAMKGLSAGSYTLEVLSPQPHWRGGTLAIPIDPVRIRDADVQRDFDVSADLPGTIEGRLHLTGAPFSPERLVVTATRKTDRFSYRAQDDQPVRGLVAANGAFWITVVPGIHKLRVVDLATKIVLLEDLDHVTVDARAVAQKDLDLELTEVRVFLEPENEGEPIVASRLEVVVRHEQDDDAAEFVMTDAAWDSATGVSLADGSREVTLFLPDIATKLRVHTNLHALSREPNTLWSAPEPLAEYEFTPRLGESNRVEVVVKRPQR